MSWYATKKASKLPQMDKASILVFDTETTGLSPATDEILQISILDGYGSTLFSSYIRPAHRKRWPAAKKVNHITWDMVKDAPTFKTVRDEIQQYFDKAKLIVGYNINFDLNFIEAAGIVVSGQIFDVMTAFSSYRRAVDHVFVNRYTLVQASRYFGHSFSPHDAYSDASATLDVFNSLISDIRFVTYKPSEKKELKQKKGGVSPSRKKLGPALNIKTVRRRPLLTGSFLILLSAGLLYYYSGILPNSIETARAAIRFAAANYRDNIFLPIALAALLIGALTIAFSLIRGIIRFPRWISAKVRHVYHSFSS